MPAVPYMLTVRVLLALALRAACAESHRCTTVPGRRTVPFKCFGWAVPPAIELDVRHMDVNDIIRMRDLPALDGCSLAVKVSAGSSGPSLLQVAQPAASTLAVCRSGPWQSAPLALLHQKRTAFAALSSRA
jgi:hypothetical protein